MKVINLTKACEGVIPTNIAALAHQQIAENMREANMPLRYMSFRRFQNHHWNAHLETLLNEVPVYLVESSQVGQTIEVYGRKVSVPQDRYETRDCEKAVDEWFNKMHEKYASTEPGSIEEPDIFNMSDGESREFYIHSFLPVPEYNPGGSQYDLGIGAYSIYDPFGVYQRNADGSIFPAEIFVWVDRVQQAHDDLICNAVNDFGEKVFDANEDWMYSLVQFAVQMEYAHYLLDPRTYGAYVHSDLDYNSPLYQYYEAMGAVGFARATMDARYNMEEMDAVNALIASMSEEYAAGGANHKAMRHYDKGYCNWLMSKVMFDEVILDALRFSWYKTGKRRSGDFRSHATPFYPEFENGMNLDVHERYISDSHGVVCYSDDVTFHRSERHWHVCCKALEVGRQYRVYDRGLFVIKGDLESVHRLGETPYFEIKMCNSLYGIVDCEGHLVVPCVYDNIDEYLIADIFLVRKNGKEGLINGEGKIVVPVEYDEIGDIDMDAMKVFGSIKAMKMNCLASQSARSLKGRISIKVTREGKEDSMEIEV